LSTVGTVGGGLFDRDNQIGEQSCLGGGGGGLRNCRALEDCDGEGSIGPDPDHMDFLPGIPHVVVVKQASSSYDTRLVSISHPAIDSPLADYECITIHNYIIQWKF